MFTGIIEKTGKIESTKKKGSSIEFTVSVSESSFFKNVKTGDSISVNGACMTIESLKGNKFKFTTVKESLKKTNLGFLNTGGFVNLEKPMKLNSSLDGHSVQGHVDTCGKVEKFINVNNSYELYISFPAAFRDCIIYTGSIAVDGISLTVADILKDTKQKTHIKIAIIPHTYKVTNMMYLKKNDYVNIEFDMIGKYIKRILNK